MTHHMRVQKRRRINFSPAFFAFRCPEVIPIEWNRFWIGCSWPHLLLASIVARTAITMPVLATTGALESFRFSWRSALRRELADMQPLVSTVMRDTLKRIWRQQRGFVRTLRCGTLWGELKKLARRLGRS